MKHRYHGAAAPLGFCQVQSGENDLGPLNADGHSRHGGYLLRGWSHRQESLPCASCPGTFIAPPQKCQPLQSCWWPSWPARSPACDGSTAWLFAWMGDCTIPIQEPPWADGEMLVGLLTTHLEPGEDMVSEGGRDREHLGCILSSTLFRCKKKIDMGSSLQVWGTHLPFVLSEWNINQQNKVGWHKT